MKTISSPTNPVFRTLRQLATNAKIRKKSHQTLLEGVHLAQGYLSSGLWPRQYVVSEDAVSHTEVGQIIAQCDAHGIPGVIVPPTLFKQFSDVEHGVGLLFVIDIPKTPTPQALTRSAVLLEDVQDPGNVGTILRTAAAAGITHVYCSSGVASVWSPKVLRSGMGAHFALTIYEQAELSSLISTAAIQVLATSLHATQSIYECDLTRPTAWVFGNEGQGVSESLLSLRIEQVIIPQVTNVESLNVSAAAAVCMFEQARQNGGTITR